VEAALVDRRWSFISEQQPGLGFVAHLQAKTETKQNAAWLWLGLSMAPIYYSAFTPATLDTSCRDILKMGATQLYLIIES